MFPFDGASLDSTLAPFWLSPGSTCWFNPFSNSMNHYINSYLSETFKHSHIINPTVSSTSMTWQLLLLLPWNLETRWPSPILYVGGHEAPWRETKELWQALTITWGHLRSSSHQLTCWLNPGTWMSQAEWAELAWPEELPLGSWSKQLVFKPLGF